MLNPNLVYEMDQLLQLQQTNLSLIVQKSVTESGGMVLGPLSPRRIPPPEALPEAPAFSAFFLVASVELQTSRDPIPRREEKTKSARGR